MPLPTSFQDVVDTSSQIRKSFMLKRKLYYSLILIVVLQLTLSQNAFAYLDPGTGSYVFQVLIATFIGGLFTIKMYWQKIKNFFSNLFSKKKAP